MVTMIIVDDDVLELESLVKYINWNMIDVSVVTTASNGMDALEKIVEYKPNIVLTDIQMPVMDGLELVRQVNALNKSIKTILFSAFDEFEYARKALNLNVVGYVLKPIQTEELLYCVKQAVALINEERLTKLTITQLSADIHSKLTIMDDSAAHALLLWNDARVKSYIKTSNLKWMLANEGYRSIVLLKCDGEQDGYSLIHQASLLLPEDVFSARTFVRLSYTENAVALYSDQLPDSDALEEDMMLNLQGENGRVCVCISSGAAAVQAWNTLMRDVSNRLNGRWEMALLMDAQEKPLNGDKQKLKLEADVQKLYLQLMSVFQTYDEQRLSATICQAYADMFSDMNEHAKMYMMVLCVESAAAAAGANPMYAIAACANVRDQVLRVEEAQADIVLQYALFSALRVSRELDEQIDVNIKRVLEIIKSKFDAQLTVNDIAREMHYSPNYLGTVFRAKTGVGIGEYLTKYRLIKAMDMLTNTVSVKYNRVCTLPEPLRATA